MRGIGFAKGLAEVYQIHNFDKASGGKLVDGGAMKIDPRYRPGAEVRELSARLITAASTGDMITCTSIVERYGIGLVNMGDYDMRTPLHLACSERQTASEAAAKRASVRPGEGEESDAASNQMHQSARCGRGVTTRHVRRKI